MKTLFGVLLLILSILLSGCGLDMKVAIEFKPDSVLVFCDSMGYGEYPWPQQLQELSSMPVVSNCIGGIRLDQYDVVGLVEKNPPKFPGNYAVLALGGNDMLQGRNRQDTQEQYSYTLDYLKGLGYTPVCFTYPYSIQRSNGELQLYNKFIESLCTEQGYLVLTSSEQLWDGIHYNYEGVTETAVNAWRLLFDGEQE